MSYNDKDYGEVFPTRTGTPSGTAQERKMLDKVGDTGGFHTSMINNGDGSVTMLRTRNGFPEFSKDEVKTSQEPIVYRGFVASLGTRAVLYTPEGPLTPRKSNYKVIGQTYFVHPFATACQNTESFGYAWGDVLTNVGTTFYYNGRSKTLPISASGGFEVLYAKFDSKTVVAAPTSVSVYSDAELYVTQALLPGEPYGEWRSLVSGVVVASENVKMGQVFFTGAGFNDPTGTWVHSETTVDFGKSVPNASYTTAIAEMTGTLPAYETDFPEESTSSFSVNVCTGATYAWGLGGTGTHQAYDQDGTPWPLYTLYANAQEDNTSEPVFGSVKGTETKSLTVFRYASKGTSAVVLGESIFSFAYSNDLDIKAGTVSRSIDEQVIGGFPDGAPSGALGSYELNGGAWSADFQGFPRDHSYSRTIPGGGMPDTSELETKAQTVSFYAAVDGTELIAGGMSNIAKSGAELDTLPRDAPAFGPGSDTEAAFFNVVATSKETCVADGQAVTAKAGEFAGMTTYYANTIVVTGLAYCTVVPVNSYARVLDVITTDYLLDDRANGVYVAVVGALRVVDEDNDSVGSLTITLRISGLGYTADYVLFSSSQVSTELLEVDLPNTTKTCLPTPTIRAFYAPMHKCQGSFRGIAYTEPSASVEIPTHELAANFELTLVDHTSIGLERSQYASGSTRIAFVPLNLLEILYGFVYSDSYGAGSDFSKYPITRAATYNSLHDKLFGVKHSIRYRNGVFYDWTQDLPMPFKGNIATELSRT